MAVYMGMERAAVDVEESDDHLVRDTLAGRREAFAELVRRHERHVHAVAWAVLRDHHAAEDVTQDAFVKAYDRLATLRSPGAVGAWLLTTARRMASDRARAGRRLVLVADAPDVAAADPPAESDADAAAVYAAIARLPVHEQQAVLLRFADGLPVADVARRLGRPVGTVTRQLSRAMARLRAQLTEAP